MRNYPRLELIPFGRQLLETGDLDPVYIAFAETVTDPAQQARWLIAYWCFYACGFACWASELDDKKFWAAMMEAAQNSTISPAGGRWPRGHERRHARGVQGVAMVTSLIEKYEHPIHMLYYLKNAAPHYAAVADRAQEHTLFGPWIAFKIADMLERVADCHVDFSAAEIFMFDTPRKGALLFWEKELGRGVNEPVDEDEQISRVIEHILSELGDFDAPPAMDRLIGLQEVETILCKWKSHLGGHYPLWNDIDDVSMGCEGWRSRSATAQQFWKTLPRRQKCVGTLL